MNGFIGYVYLTTNLVNGKQYVGQHLSDGFDEKYKGSGTYIKNALNKYGWDNFTCEVLQWCSTQIQLDVVEDNCIKLYNTMYPNGYNLMGGGNGGDKSKEARKNMSTSAKKRFENQEEHKKLSQAHKGIRAGMLGKTHSEKSKQKMSKAHKQMSNETKSKISNSNKGRKVWNKGLKMPKAFGEKVSLAKRGKNNGSGSKVVLQFTKDGEFVKEWVSLSEVHRQLGYGITGLSACCLGQLKSYKGSIWRYACNTHLETPLQTQQ